MIDMAIRGSGEHYAHNLLALALFGITTFASAVSAQDLHQDQDGKWLNEAGGNLYGDGQFNMDADPRFNMDADPRFNMDADPRFNMDADPRFNTDADPRFSIDGDPRYRNRDGVGDSGDDDD